MVKTELEMCLAAPVFQHRGGEPISLQQYSHCGGKQNGARLMGAQWYAAFRTLSDKYNHIIPIYSTSAGA